MLYNLITFYVAIAKCSMKFNVLDQSRNFLGAVFIVPSDGMSNKFHASHWLSEKKKEKSSLSANEMHETCFT